MKVSSFIQQHEEAIELLSNIKHAYNRRQIWIDGLENARYFPDLSKEYLHNIEISNAAINRLWDRYRKLINKMNNY